MLPGKPQDIFHCSPPVLPALEETKTRFSSFFTGTAQLGSFLSLFFFGIILWFLSKFNNKTMNGLRMVFMKEQPPFRIWINKQEHEYFICICEILENIKPLYVFQIFLMCLFIGLVMALTTWCCPTSQLKCVVLTESTDTMSTIYISQIWKFETQVSIYSVLTIEKNNKNNFSLIFLICFWLKRNTIIIGTGSCYHNI